MYDFTNSKIKHDCLIIINLQSYSANKSIVSFLLNLANTLRKNII